METNNYVVGRGRVSFGQFKAGTNTLIGGELYFGNTPEFSLTGDTETLDHYSSDEGLRNLDNSVLLELTQGGSFTCDNISAENVALFFLGDAVKTVQTQQTGVKENIPLVRRGRYYQLGTSEDNPTGVRNVANFTMVALDASISVSAGAGDISAIPGAVVVPAAGNYEIDLATARVYIEPDAPAFAGDIQAFVQFDVEAQSRTMIIGKSNMIYGTLRFESDNPVGTNKDFFFPKVALQPDGDYNLKGDDWQVLGFSFKALKINQKTQRVYIDVREAAGAGDPASERYVSLTLGASAGAAGSNVAVTVTVRDGNNNVVEGEVVTFSTVAGATVTPASGTTNATGQAVTQLSRVAAGTATVTATLATGQSALSGVVTFS